ncbi:hypothetical protein CNMCM5878_001991 [Aspergillus fumigatiaffinis]|nr:hypothetical protein CNMCM5878_001991 [Aspergillus fumigatiaffinis]KAF4215952.1 hypothetical protein CNMCM6457_005571 [Aspergillus fumigatiaffinis]
MAFQMPFIWPSVVVLPFLQFLRGRREEREEGSCPVPHWQGHMIAVLIQAASACTPGFPQNKRALLCHYAGVVPPQLAEEGPASWGVKKTDGRPQGLVIENLMNSRLDDLGLRKVSYLIFRVVIIWDICRTGCEDHGPQEIMKLRG